MRLHQDPQYRRLPVSQRSIGRQVSLWLAADHLLVVDVAGFIERYRRYRLEDLRAVVVRPTRTGRVVALVLGGLLLAACALLGLVLVLVAREGFSPATVPFLVVAAIPAVLLLVATLVSLLRISTGDVVLVTTAHEGRIPGISQLATARRVAEILASEIAQPPGAMPDRTPEDVG